jgi:hypothetical protein
MMNKLKTFVLGTAVVVISTAVLAGCAGTTSKTSSTSTQSSTSTPTTTLTSSSTVQTTSSQSSQVTTPSTSTTKKSDVERDIAIPVSTGIFYGDDIPVYAGSVKGEEKSVIEQYNVSYTAPKDDFVKIIWFYKEQMVKQGGWEFSQYTSFDKADLVNAGTVTLMFIKKGFQIDCDCTISILRKDDATYIGIMKYNFDNNY